MIEKYGSMYVLKAKQRLPMSKAEAWDFLSDPKNLKVITPDYMGFDILEGADKRMHQGQIIQYIVKPVMNIKTKWVTEITHCVPQEFFVDEQRFGPYALWHHKHFLHEDGKETIMEDVIHYKLPFSPISNWFHNLIVKPRLEGIFSYREQKLTALFGAA